MNYQRIYDQLVERAQYENRKKSKNQYFERHHIIPISINGSNDKENLVLLTAREHFVAHKLLVEIHPGNKKLIHALWMMLTKSCSTGGRIYSVGSKEYERAKIIQSGVIIERNKDVEFRNKISKSRTGKKSSKETRDKLSKMRKGSLNSNFGNKMSDESKKKISESNKGKVSWNKGKKNMQDNSIFNEILKCPYCGKLGKLLVIKRWHFDNCKFKNDEKSDYIFI